MAESLYNHARYYDLMFPDSDGAIAFYRAQAAAGSRVLELASGTGSKLIPLAADGHDATGLDLFPNMLHEASRKAEVAGVEVNLVEGDMRSFDLGTTFHLIYLTGNSLLHLHSHRDIIACFTAVRRHLAPGGLFAFDIFNPDVGFLGTLDGSRQARPDLTFVDPERGTVYVDVTETYDGATQITQNTWQFSTSFTPDFLTTEFRLRNIFPAELLALLDFSGLSLIERFGDWASGPFTGDSGIQVCVCRVAT